MPAQDDVIAAGRRSRQRVQHLRRMHGVAHPKPLHTFPDQDIPRFAKWQAGATAARARRSPYSGE
eukprot:9311835-Alexandrium_andersonii.AAC.1